jgi:hypothetical protein
MQFAQIALVITEKAAFEDVHVKGLIHTAMLLQPFFG